MKFDFVIGNPPYQEDNAGNNRKSPIYHIFMDSAYSIAEKVELITPSRFLFDAGQTPKEWNRKILGDEHFKILTYEANASNIFPNTDIKGGIVISYRDNSRVFGAINEFIINDVLQNIVNKVKLINFESLSEIHFNRSSYKLTDRIYENFPELLGNVNQSERFAVTSNIFEKLDKIFFEQKPNDDEYYCILGRENNNRILKYVNVSYVAEHPNINDWKVFLAKSNGRGDFGEMLAEPEIGKPGMIATQTFISFGKFANESEAINLKKYLKTKFSRTLLDIKKVTPDNARKEVWMYVPLQDFTGDIDIDWSKSIKEIDQQLYKKYNLTNEEINFIETKVKEME